MSTSAWTLEGELNELAGKNNLVESLQALALIRPGDTLASLETVSDWYRSGAETYGLHFRVMTRSGQRCECFMKACVAYAGGVPLKQIFTEWLTRRALVEGLGISTPKLYATGPALLVEEYIPHTLSNAFQVAGDRGALLRAVAQASARLVNAGFAPLSAHDWRSRGSDLVLVDFGQDLGPAGMVHGCESGLLSEVLDNLANAGVELSSADLQLVGAVYEQILHI